MPCHPVKFFLSVSIFLCACLALNAQPSANNLLQNPVVRLHYDSLELAGMQQSDSVKYNAIRYYYTQSFLYEITGDCSCTPPAASSFDVSHYEYLRKRDVRVERYFEKYGFKLTLLSIQEMPYRLPIHNP